MLNSGLKSGMLGSYPLVQPVATKPSEMPGLVPKIRSAIMEPKECPMMITFLALCLRMGLLLFCRDLEDQMI
jgi:hypothetical protein